MSSTPTQHVVVIAFCFMSVVGAIRRLRVPAVYDLSAPSVQVAHSNCNRQNTERTDRTDVTDTQKPDKHVVVIAFCFISVVGAIRRRRVPVVCDLSAPSVRVA